MPLPLLFVVDGVTVFSSWPDDDWTKIFVAHVTLATVNSGGPKISSPMSLPEDLLATIAAERDEIDGLLGSEPMTIKESGFSTRANASCSWDARRLGESAILVQKSRKSEVACIRLC